MTTATDRAIEILLVEDNPADARLTQEIIGQSEHRTNITVAEDGEVAMAILKGEATTAARRGRISFCWT